MNTNAYMHAPRWHSRVTASYQHTNNTQTPLCVRSNYDMTEQALLINIGPLGFHTEEECKITVLRGHAQFSVKVKTARVKDTPFGEELLQRIKLCLGCTFGRYVSVRNPVDLVYQHCLPLVKRLAPQTLLQDLTLECFLHSPTYHLELVATDNNENIRIEGEQHCLYTPAFAISPMRTADLPVPCKNIPHFQACKTWIASTTRDKEKSLNTIQGGVITANGSAMYFKPRIDGREREFERELRLMTRIKEADLGALIRVPTLEGIVVAGENRETTMGMLMTLITSPEIGIHLQSPGFQSQPELHKKWEKQVTAIVQELHANDIVWGDVNPMNVVIDEALDAWVIDFGGNNNVQFVDDEKCETFEGDKQGVMRLFQEWLPSRVIEL